MRFAKRPYPRRRNTQIREAPHTKVCQAAVLGDALSVFSLDVVGVVAAYVVCGAATSGALPSHLFSFGSVGKTNGKFTGGCYSLACGSDGNVWVGDDGGCQIFSSEGKFIRRVANGYFSSRCLGIAFDRNGEVFCADTDGHRILVCRLDGCFVRTFRLHGGGSVRRKSPYGLAVDGNGLLFIVDYQNHHVQVLRRDGKFVRSFGSRGLGDGQFHFPYGAAVSAKAEIFVADPNNYRVQVIRLFLCRVRYCVAGVRRQRKVPAQVQRRGLRTRTVQLPLRYRIGPRGQCFRLRSRQQLRANFQVRRHVHHHVRLTRRR